MQFTFLPFIQYYFSVSNVIHDQYLRDNMDSVNCIL